MKITNFTGMATEPDEDQAACRLARNLVFRAAGGTKIQARPGTEQLTRATQPGAEATTPGSRTIVYQIKDNRIAGLGLIAANSGTDGTAPKPAGIYFATLGQTAISANQDAVDPSTPPPSDSGCGCY